MQYIIILPCPQLPAVGGSGVFDRDAVSLTLSLVPRASLAAV